MGGPTHHLVVGRVKKPHGVHGDLLVIAVTDEPERVFTAGRKLAVLDGDGRAMGEPLVIERCRAYQRGWLIHFVGADDRSEVEPLRERVLGVEAGELRPLEPDEYYHHELIGMRVELAGAEGEAAGEVSAVVEAPQGELLEVRSGERERLVPLRGGMVRSVDRATRVIVIATTPGLWDL